MPACEQDNLDHYRATGIFEVTDRPLKCDPSDPDIWTFTWAFIDNETKIPYDGSDVYELIEVTELILKLRASFVENGVSYVHEETYSH